MAESCSRHPDRGSDGVCVRCGAQTCVMCKVDVDGVHYCSIICFTEATLATKRKSLREPASSADPLADLALSESPAPADPADALKDPSIVLGAQQAESQDDSSLLVKKEDASETSILDLGDLKRTEESSILQMKAKQDHTSILGMGAIGKANKASDLPTWMDEPPKTETPLPMVLPGTRRTTIESTCVFHKDTPAIVRCSRCGDSICTLCVTDEAQGGRCSPSCRRDLAARARMRLIRGLLIGTAAAAALFIGVRVFGSKKEEPPKLPSPAATAEADAKEAEAAGIARATEEARARVKAREREEAEAKAREEAAAKEAALAKAKALEEAQARAIAEAAKAEALAKAKAREEAEARAKADAAKAEALAKMKAAEEAEARAKAEALAKAKAREEAEARAKADAAKAEALAKMKAAEEAEAKSKAEARAKAEALAKAKAREEAEARAKAEAAKAEALAKMKAAEEVEAKAKAEALAKADAAAKAEALAKAKALEEAEAREKAKRAAIESSLTTAALRIREAAPLFEQLVGRYDRDAAEPERAAQLALASQVRSKLAEAQTLYRDVKESAPSPELIGSRIKALTALIESVDLVLQGPPNPSR